MREQTAVTVALFPVIAELLSVADNDDVKVSK